MPTVAESRTAAVSPAPSPEERLSVRNTPANLRWLKTEVPAGPAVARQKRSIAGVVVGVLVAMAAFARRAARFVSMDRVVERRDGEDTAVHTVHGELFLASSNTGEYAHYGKEVAIVGLDRASRRMRFRLGGMLSRRGH